jgi:hypothetical protein
MTHTKLCCHQMTHTKNCVVVKCDISIAPYLHCLCMLMSSPGNSQGTAAKIRQWFFGHPTETSAKCRKISTLFFLSFKLQDVQYFVIYITVYWFFLNESNHRKSLLHFFKVRCTFRSEYKFNLFKGTVLRDRF